MQVFPAIDLMDGAAVRLEQGRRDSAKIYSRAPWEVAARFAAAGAGRLHVVDLDAAFSRASNERKDNRDTIAQDRRGDAHQVEAGGGVRTVDDCARAVRSRACKFAVLGTAAVKDPAMVEAACTRWPGRIVVAVDAREGQGRGRGLDRGRPAPTPWTMGAVGRAGGRRRGPLHRHRARRDARRSEPGRDRAAGPAAAPLPRDRVGRRGAAGGSGRAGPDRRSAVVVGKALYEKVFTVEEALARAREAERG